MFSGYLRQQVMTDEGLYMWKKQFYSLNSTNKTMEVYDTEEEYERSGASELKNLYINLIGVQYAKEWSVVIPDSDVGFDLVWDSGNIWSFLVESQSLCCKWVDYFNKCSVNSVNVSKNEPRIAQEEVSESGTTFVHPQDETQFPNNLTATPIMPKRATKQDPNNLTSLLSNPMHGNVTGSNPHISPIRGNNSLNSQSDSAKSTNTSSPNSDTNEVLTQTTQSSVIPKVSSSNPTPPMMNTAMNIPPPPPFKEEPIQQHPQPFASSNVHGIAIANRDTAVDDHVAELEKK